MESRIKYVKVSRIAFEQFFIGGSEVRVTEGLPEDAEMVNLEYRADRDWFQITFRSDEFDPIPEAGKVPEADGVKIESIEDE